MNMCTQWCQSKAWVIGFRGSAPQSRPDWWFRLRLLAVVWQTLLGTYWNRLNHVYLLKTTAPPAPSQKKETATAQVYESNMKLWCHLVCIPVKPSSLPGKVTQRAWAIHMNISQRWLTACIPQERCLKRIPWNPLGDCIFSQPFIFQSEAGHFPQSLCRAHANSEHQRRQKEKGKQWKKLEVKAGKLRIEWMDRRWEKGMRYSNKARSVQKCSFRRRGMPFNICFP